MEVETKREYSSFHGAELKYTGTFSFSNKNSYLNYVKDSHNGSPHMKEIPNTSLLVSLHHDAGRSANMEIYDIATKGQVNKIYSFEVVSSGSKMINKISPVRLTTLFFYSHRNGGCYLQFTKESPRNDLCQG